MTKARDIASAIPAPSTVSSAELGYLDGVTSAIQTQVDAKIAKTLTSTTGDIIYASGANTPARLGIGSTGNVLTVAGGVPSWATPATPSSGLNQIIPTSTANSGGLVSTSASGAVTFTSVNSVSLNGIFTSSYDNYLILANNLTSASAINAYYRLRNSGTDAATNYDNMNIYKDFASGASSPSSIGTSITGSTTMYAGELNSSYAVGHDLHISNPKIASYSSFWGSFISNGYVNLISGMQKTTTQFDGLTYLANGSVTMSGTIRVYGYSN